MSSVSSSPISPVALQPPSFESTAVQNPALSSESPRSSGDTVSIKKEKSDAEPSFFKKIFNFFSSSKEPGSDPSSEKGIWERFRGLFTRKDENGNESNWFVKMWEKFSKSSKDETHHLSLPPRL